MSASKILNLTNALQFSDIFGFNLVSKFQASPYELSEAKRFYEEFNEYRNDREAGEEYELVQHWGDDLGLSKYFELIDENVYRKKNNLEDLLTSIENDPFDLESDKEFKKEQTDLFMKSQQTIGTNMAVVMFMVEALQFFKNMSKDKIKKVAFEIAMQGTQGFKPEGTNYRISAIPGKLFSGYHILAYYYVSWALAVPEMLAELNLPYDNEYEIALSFK